MLMSLLGLGIGMMFASFQTFILLSLIAALYMFVRYCSPFLPMFLRWLMLSGPVELLFLFLFFYCCLYLLSCDVYLCWL